MRLPRPTIRLRLSLWYAALFFLSGALLLGLNYFLLRNSFVVSPQNVNLAVSVRLGIPESQLNPALQPSDGGVTVGGVPLSTILKAVQQEVTGWSLRQLAVKSGIALALMALVSLGLGWIVSGRMLRPLKEITSTARRLSETTLGERIALDGPRDELKELADTFDAMLARLDAAFRAQRDFVANASHELRTPLTIIRTELDVTLSEPDVTREELQGMEVAIREAVDRSDQLIDRLLVLARSEGPGVRELVDLAAVASRAAGSYSMEADAKQLGLELELQPAPVEGEPVLLERVVGNLVENAIRHNETGGYFRIETGSEGDTAWLRVSNNGPVIAPEEAERLFERFYRPDRSRSRATGGSGLGLSIVRTVVEAHGGTAEARPLPEGGLEVTVRLPRATSSPEVG
jgi:signal transduction histidine kinase